jgi:hypothetical protein
VLGARLAQHRQRLARGDDQRPQVHPELDVQVLGLDLLHRLADPDSGVVDEDVEPSIALAVGVNRSDHLLLAGHVAGHRLDLEAFTAQRLGCGLQRVGPAGRDRQGVAVLAQRTGNRVTDSPRPTGDERRPFRQKSSSRCSARDRGAPYRGAAGPVRRIAKRAS